MLVKDTDVLTLVEKTAVHFGNNISNRYLKRALNSLRLDSADWNKIEFFKDRYESLCLEGFDFVDLYEYILAFGRFVFQSRLELVPSLRSRLGLRRGGEPDAVLHNMAVNNFESNMDILSDTVQELYMRVAQLDKLHNDPTVASRMLDLASLGNLLVKS